MSLLTITLLTLSFLCLVAIIGLVLYVKKQKTLLTHIETQLTTVEFTVSELEYSFSQQKILLENKLSAIESDKTENDQISQSLERRIKSLQTEQIEISDKLSAQIDINDKLTSLTEQQPEDRLYSRALKLAGLGADLEEIMRDCDMPRVEAEMLLSIHQKRNK